MKTSIILLSYNQIEYTLACIETIKTFTDAGSYEIIVVDNNSNSDTVSRLEATEGIILIKNKINKGFSGGCNDGIRVATGDNILLLNNDTLVTKNWLTNMITALYSSKDIGAVGPVTNSCSNFQTIPCNYANLDDMFKFAEDHNKTNPSQWEERPRLIGYALLIKKEVLDKVGLLDTIFFPGNYEDDDLCLRIRIAGYRLLLCKDTFIHHFGSMSFSAEKEEKTSKIMQINMEKFIQKWGLDRNSNIYNISNDQVEKLKQKTQSKEKEIISFIYVTNNEDMFQASAEHLQRLIIPENVDLEIIKVTDAKSIYSGYNQGMKIAKGKYKVYLHQDLNIINPNFINDILFTFKSSEKLGMIGLVGGKYNPIAGTWWGSSNQAYGQIFETRVPGEVNIIKLLDPVVPYEAVSGIDGVLMVTQYDLPWREDVFEGWHYYDISQCQEFLKAGYEIGIPVQIDPWAIHDFQGKSMNEGFDSNKSKFLDFYFPNNPLVTIAIPTYNRPEYFKIALDSALKQTYPNIEIIISDDSSNDETKELYEKEYSHIDRIKYIKNEKAYGPIGNLKRCVELANGEYFNLLMDDDIFYPNKIERMLMPFLEFKNDNLTLVSSKRDLINVDGELCHDNYINTPIVSGTGTVSGKLYANAMLTNIANFIGEPTTPLCRKSDLKEFFKFNGRDYYFSADMATWIQLLAKGNLYYFMDSLSQFRIHDGQGQAKVNRYHAAADFLHQVLNARSIGLLEDDKDYASAISKCKEMGDTIASQKLKDDPVDFWELYKQVQQEYSKLKSSKLV